AAQLGRIGRSRDGTPIVKFVANFIIAPLMRLDSMASWSVRASIALERGSGLDASIKIVCDDEVHLITFTDDRHGYHPDQDFRPGNAATLSGKICFWLARDLAEIEPPIEYRTVPFTAESVTP